MQYETSLFPCMSSDSWPPSKTLELEGNVSFVSQIVSILEKKDEEIQEFN